MRKRLFLLPLVNRVGDHEIMLAGESDELVGRIVSGLTLRSHSNEVELWCSRRRLSGERRNHELNTSEPVTFPGSSDSVTTIGAAPINATRLPMGVILLEYGDRFLAWDIAFQGRDGVVPCDRCLGPVTLDADDGSCVYCGYSKVNQMTWAKLPTIIDLRRGQPHHNHAKFDGWFTR